MSNIKENINLKTWPLARNLQTKEGQAKNKQNKGIKIKIPQKVSRIIY